MAAAAVRLLTILLLLFPLPYVLAHPLAYQPYSVTPHLLLPRTLTLTNSSGTVQVIDPSSQSTIPQAPATDGSGSGFDLPAIIWILFSLVVGIPMSCAGIRGWRITTGVGIGVSLTVCAWAALNNTLSPPALPDIVLTLITLAFFVLGFILGCFEFSRLASIALLVLAGGTSIGVRIVLLRDGLLISSSSSGLAEDGLYVVNWVVVGVCAAIAGGGLWWSQRVSLLVGCSSIGTFLTSLGIDLVANKQSGFSRGLRFLMDRNDSHLADIITNGYTPPLLTKIIIASSLALIPILAYAQHKIFPHPFNRNPRYNDEDELSSTLSNEIGYPNSEDNKRLGSMTFPPPESGVSRKASNKLAKSSSRFSL